MNAHDAINPLHYRRGAIECIDYILRWHPTSFLLGNAVKYICRMGYKGDAAEDWKKALWYMRRAGALSDFPYPDIGDLMRTSHWPTSTAIVPENFPLDPQDPLFDDKANLLIYLREYGAK